MRCKICNTKFKPIYFLQKSCTKPSCILEYSKIAKEKAWKKVKRNKRTTHSSLYIKENKSDLQDTINHIARLIDKGIRCIDCDRTESKPHWDGGHRKSRGSTSSIRYNLHNIFKQTRYCNSMSEGNKSAYNEGLIKMYGKDYFNLVDGLALKYSYVKIMHQEIPIALKEARKILRELKKVDLEYPAATRIKLREELNKRIGIYIN